MAPTGVVQLPRLPGTIWSLALSSFPVRSSPVAFTNSLFLGRCWSGFYLKQMITDPDCSEICERGCVLHGARGLSIYHAFYESGTSLSTNLGEHMGRGACFEHVVSPACLYNGDHVKPPDSPLWVLGRSQRNRRVLCPHWDYGAHLFRPWQ